MYCVAGSHRGFDVARFSRRSRREIMGTMKKSVTLLHAPSRPAVTDAAPGDEDVLMAELRKRHPEIYDERPAPRARRTGTNTRIDRDLASALADPVPESRHEVPPGTLADFVAGTCALTLMPAAACSPAERDMFFSELLPLRQALVQEFRAVSASDVMLVDVVVSALFESRRLSVKAASIIVNASLENVRAAELVERMAARAHGRFVGAIEMLRRAQRAPVSFEVEDVEREDVDAAGVQGART